MKSSKLFELLFSLSRKELHDCAKFARLSMNNLLNIDLEILDFLVESINPEEPMNESESKLVTSISDRFFNGFHANGTKNSWNHTKSRLTSSINRYIAMIQMENHPTIRDRFLLTYYHNKQLDKNLNGIFKKAKKNLERRPHDYDQAYHQYKLEELLQFQQQGEWKKVGEGTRMMEQALDHFYYENKLRLLVEKYSLHRIIGSPQPDETLIRQIDSGEVSGKSIRIQLFYHLIQMMKAPMEIGHYFDAANLFYEHEKTLADVYKLSVIEYLMNQCIQYCHTDRLEFAQEYTKHLKFLLKTKLYSPQKGLSIQKYSNGIYMALITGDLPWAEQIVREHSSLVKHESTTALKQLNEANILFHKGQREAALERLLHQPKLELYFKIAYDKLCIKLYFELRMNRILNSKLAAFQQYLNRSEKLPAGRKTKNLNFIEAIRLLKKRKLNSKNIIRNDYLILDYQWLEKQKGGMQP